MLNWAILSTYYIYPYLAAKNTNEITPLSMFVAVLLYSLGTFLHYGAEAQKHYTLKFRGSGLITDDIYNRGRN